MTRYAGIDFVQIVEQSGVKLTKRANNQYSGEEYWGPCPFCHAGDDRFHVWPQGSRPHFWCRVCGREGSPAFFLMEQDAISFAEALERLGLDDEDEQDEYIPPSLSEKLSPPSKQWQAAAWAMIARAEKYLWHPKSKEGQQALAYLRKRGLCDETIRAARIGCVPLARDGRWYKGAFEEWGIDVSTLRADVAAKGGVAIPDGILLPWIEGKTVWKLCVKRPGCHPSYGQVVGSSNGGLYGVETIAADMPVVLVESEFCQLSIRQEAGDVTACVATGGTQKGRVDSSDLAYASCMLQSFDADNAGDQASQYWLAQFPEKSMRWRPWSDEDHFFKDPNAILQHQEDFQAYTGYTLRAWVQLGIGVVTLPTAQKCNEQPLVQPVQQSKDYWEGVRAKLSCEYIGKVPFYEYVQNWRPDVHDYAHIPGGYAGYCQMYTGAQ